MKLAEPTLETIPPARSHADGSRSWPKRIVADKGYDWDALRGRFLARGIELIAPHRRGRTRPALQDGRSLRRYRRRWKIERTIAWIGNFRRVVVRYERRLRVYEAFLKIACLMIALRGL